MTNPDEGKPNGAENDSSNIRSQFDDSTAVNIDLPDESKTHLINGGAGADDHPEKFKTAIVDPRATSDGEVSFNGLGKDEVLQYANDPFWVRLRWIMFILFWIGWLAMLVTAIAIIVLAPRCPHRPDLKWYHTDNVYQVYAKSFKDSDDNGVGDFEGLKDKLDYITDDLKTQALWLSSVYKADADGTGMGIIDHKLLDPVFLDDTDKFRSWVKKQRKDGKKVIMDLIPNQTSKKHGWFMKSVNKEGDYKDYYVWSETQPNNWKMVGSDKSAWTYDNTRKEYYLHQFSEEYPDLNLNNSKVVEEIKDIMKYWLDAGVSGFNIRHVEYLVENPDLSVADDEHRNQTRNYVGTLAFLEELRKVADDFSDKPGRERVLYATVYDADRAQIEAYWGTKKNKRLHIVAPFMEKVRDTACNAICIKDMVEKVISDDIEEEQWLGLQVGDQDQSRITSELAMKDPTNFEYRLVNAHALQLLLPGTPLVYYGDEFGQRNGVDSVNGTDTDKYHGPMQWDNTENAGFTGKGVTPYIGLSPTYKTDNVEVGQVIFKDTTPFVTYQTLTELRNEESFQFGKTKLCTVGDNVLMFSRHAHRFPYFITLVNMGASDVTVSSSDLKCLEVKDEAVVRFHSRDEKVGDTLDMEDQSVHLQPFDVVVLQFAAED